ncbi:MAG: hypothetical protein KY457_05515 [Actinobacteria bacterium]|nr:hypothetical protein [Actinomycetota bacterium]
MPDEPYTPQGRTEGDEEPEGAPATTPQARTDDEDGVEEGRPGDEA